MRAVLLLLALPVLVSLGCSDSGTSNDDTDNPIGLTITESGLVLVSVELTTVQGSISVEPGESSRTLLVEFNNGQGAAVSTEGRYMEVAVSNDALATWEPTTAGSFTGKILAGLEGGTTTAQFTIYEGTVGSGTSIYTSPAITLRIEGQV